MKGRYINTKILLACLSAFSKQAETKKDIHTQLRETIAEHKRIMKQFSTLSFVKTTNEFETAERKAA